MVVISPLVLQNLLVKLAPYLGLALLCGAWFFAGYQYKGYRVDKAILAAQIEAQKHYADRLQEYIDTMGTTQVQYEDRVKELDNDQTPECNAIAPKCLVDSF